MHHHIHAVSKSAFCSDTCYSLTYFSLMLSTIILHMPSINLIIIKKNYSGSTHTKFGERSSLLDYRQITR